MAIATPTMQAAASKAGREQDDGRREDGRSFWERAGDRFASWFGEEGDYDERRDRGEHTEAVGPTGYKRADDRINDEVQSG